MLFSVVQADNKLSLLNTNQLWPYRSNNPFSHQLFGIDHITKYLQNNLEINAALIK